MGYPYAAIAQAVDGVTDVDDDFLNSLIDALNDLLTLLGTNPEGSVASVEVRIDAEHEDDGTHGSITPTSVATPSLNVNSGTINASGSTIGFHGSSPVAKGTVTGSRASGAALASLLTYLASRGDIVDSSSA